MYTLHIILNVRGLYKLFNKSDVCVFILCKKIARQIF